MAQLFQNYCRYLQISEVQLRQLEKYPDPVTEPEFEKQYECTCRLFCRLFVEQGRIRKTKDTMDLLTTDELKARRQLLNSLGLETRY